MQNIRTHRAFVFGKKVEKGGKKKVTFPDLIKSHLLSQSQGNEDDLLNLERRKLVQERERERERERQRNERSCFDLCVCMRIYTNRHTHTQTSWGLFLHDPSDLPCLECLNTVLHRVPQMSIKYKKEQKTKTKKTRTRAQQQQQLK